MTLHKQSFSISIWLFFWVCIALFRCISFWPVLFGRQLSYHILVQGYYSLLEQM